MGSQFLKTFALGMNQEISTLGQLAFAAGGTEDEQQQQPQQPLMLPQPTYAPPAPSSMEALPPQVARSAEGGPAWEDVQQNIFGGESGGDYDALFGFSNREGGDFEGTRLTDMTVDEAIEFSNPKGEYAGYVRGKVGRTATPMGAYQVVGTTLRKAKQDMGLTGDERMTPELQDEIGKYIYQTQGTDAWEGYGKGNVSMSSRNGLPTRRGNDPSVDVSDLEEDAPDMSPEMQRKRHQGAMLMAIGQGLSQLSKGEPIDISNVMEDYLDRQMEMRQRMQEINMEKRRQTERKEDRQFEREDQDYALEANMAAERRQEQATVRRDRWGEGADIRKAEREEATAKRLTAEDYSKRQSAVELMLDPANPNFDDLAPVATLMQASDYTMDFKDAYKQLHPDGGDLPAFIKEFAAYSSMPPDLQKKMLDYKTATGNTNINMGPTMEVKQYESALKRVEESRKLLSDKQTASAPLRNIRIILDEFGDEVPSGPIESSVGETARRALEELHMLNDRGEIIQGAQSFLGSQAMGMIPLVRNPGSTTEYELDKYLSALPSIGNSFLKNKLTVQSLEGNLKYDEMKQAELENYIETNKKSAGFDEHWKEMEKNGDTPVNFMDFTKTDDFNVKAALKATQRGDLSVGSVVIDVGPDGKKTFRLLDEADIQALEESAGE